MPNKVENKRSLDRRSVFGRNLAALRKAHHLTQEQVAHILKINRSTYAYYERDITPTLEVIKKLCVLFDTTVQELLYGPEEFEDYEEAYVLEDGTASPVQKLKLKDLKPNEALMLSYYRCLPAQLRAKIYKEIKDLQEKSE